MIVRRDKAAQVVDPDADAGKEDPLWAPSWPLPDVQRETDEREEEAIELRIPGDGLERLDPRIGRDR